MTERNKFLDYWLEFQLRLPYAAAPRLLIGQLTLWVNSIPSSSWKATSGLPGWQYKGAQLRVGKGPLPASKQIAPHEYRVSTIALDRKSVRGIEGYAFPILPYSISLGGVTRGDFMIHREANFPGTAGCIGLPEPDEWFGFQEAMQLISTSKVTIIPLKVNYLQA